MAFEWIAGMGQAAAGVAAMAVAGPRNDLIKWTEDGARKVADNNEKAWGKDGDAVQFCESIPGVGFVAAAGHAIAGDDEHAKRAAARGCKAALVMGGGVVGGLVGGPAGAMAGAAAGNAAGQCAEKGINHAIDKEHRTEAGTFDEFDEEEFVNEVGIAGALGGIGHCVTATAGKSVARAVVGPSMKEAGKVAIIRHARFVEKRAAEYVVSKAATTVAKPAVKPIKFYPEH